MQQKYAEKNEKWNLSLVYRKHLHSLLPHLSSWSSLVAGNLCIEYCNTFHHHIKFIGCIYYHSDRSLLACGHATRSVIVGNQTVINKNFPIRSNAFFIIFKNSPKFEYREFVSVIYAKRKFGPSSSTCIWGKYLYKLWLILENALIESIFLINFNVKLHKT